MPPHGAYVDRLGPDKSAQTCILIRAFAVWLQNHCILQNHHENIPYTPLLYSKTGIYIDCGYLLELPQQDGYNEYLQSMF